MKRASRPGTRRTVQFFILIGRDISKVAERHPRRGGEEEREEECSSGELGGSVLLLPPPEQGPNSLLIKQCNSPASAGQFEVKLGVPGLLPLDDLLTL